MDDHAADRVDEESPDKSHLGAAPRAGASFGADMRVGVTLLFTPDDTHIALIEWSMSENYPTSTNQDGTCGPVVGLYDGDKKLLEKKCNSRKSTIPWPTGIPFAPAVKLNARIYDWDCQSKGPLLMCKTDPATSPSEPVSGEANLRVEIELLQDPDTKKPRVDYKIPLNYPTSTKEDGTCGPTLALYLGDDELEETTPIHEKPTGKWIVTSEDFRSGLNARLSDWDCMSMKTFLLCKTDPVP
jgi:hypothetical protein